MSDLWRQSKVDLICDPYDKPGGTFLNQVGTSLCAECTLPSSTVKYLVGIGNPHCPPICSIGPLMCLKSIWILLRKVPIFLKSVERPDNEWQWFKSSLGCQTWLQSKIWYVLRSINSNKIHGQQLHYLHLSYLKLSWRCRSLEIDSIIRINSLPKKIL